MVSTQGSNQGNGAGHMKINRQFNKIALGNLTLGSGSVTTIELFDFDNSTGVVSNPMILNYNFGVGNIYGLEFSPDGKVLYVSELLTRLVQYDLTQPTALAIENSAFQLSSNFYQAAALQLGKDDKIYINAGTIDVINCPNKLGTSCGFQQNVITGQSGGGGYGLPKWVYYESDAPIPTTNSIVKTGNCIGLPVSFSLQNTSNIVSVSWDFGDPASGTINNTSSSLTPQHTYNTAGTYTVNVVINYPCYTETIPLTFTIDAATIPTFNTIPTLCIGDTAPILPSNSSNGITGTWNPTTISTSSSGTATYTFTPNAGQCASVIPITITVNPLVTPTFNPIPVLCIGSTAPVLPTTSLNGITGTWNPTTINTSIFGTATYTFTPNAGQCASVIPIIITVDPLVTPTFNPFPSLCVGDTAPILPTNSSNGITGTWNPSTISTSSSGTVTYTFTPSAGQCANLTPIPIIITINPLVTPTFNPLAVLCIGDTAPVLPTTSLNGITGTWNPTTISTSISGTATYTFTPNAGQCASVIPITITINPLVTPTFNPIPVLCIGGTAPVLPTTSLNGITGTWNPTTISTSISGTATYTFTPNAGQCANVIPIILTVDPLVTPTFNPFPSLCVGDTAPILPSNSSNGITGTWNPSTISTSISGMATYTFTPNAGQCANVTPIPIIITVNPLVTPTFNPIPVLCIGGTAPVLPTTSLNGITGTWNPTTISTSISGTATYTFTPNAGQCANVTPIPIIITVDPLITPTFNPISPLCNGDTAPVLPSTSLNGITGTWNPTIVSNTSSGTYTFTPNVVVGQCYSPTDINITVLPQLVPDFQDLTLCENQVGYVLNNQSPNGIIGTWSPATINFTTGGNYTFTPDAGQCASPQTILVTINSSSLTDFQWIVSEPFSGNPTITIIPNSPGNYLYQLDFGPLQTSNIFQNVSSGFHTVQVTDANGCSDTIEKKDILIADYPKFFTPNGDDYNDTWNIKGLSGLPNAKIYIFDRYGKLIKQISSTGQGWDGTYNSQQLPSDDYWFVVEFEFNNTMKLFKSHFTLKR